MTPTHLLAEAERLLHDAQEAVAALTTLATRLRELAAMADPTPTAAPNDVVRAVAAQFGVAPADMRRTQGGRRMARARQVAALILCDELGLTSVEAAKALHRHRGGVWLTVQRARELRTTDADFAAAVVAVRVAVGKRA